MEENFWWNTTFDGTWPSMKGNHQWKMTLDEVDFWLKTTVNRGLPFIEDNNQSIIAFGKRWLSMEDHFQWRTTTSDKITATRTWFKMLFYGKQRQSRRQGGKLKEWEWCCRCQLSEWRRTNCAHANIGHGQLIGISWIVNSVKLQAKSLN